MPNEERALVLDYLAAGKPDSYKAEPLAQVLGEQFFTLLEVVPKGEVKIMDSIYVGKEEREKVDYIKRRVKFEELTSTATAELEKAVEKVVSENMKRFLDFYNNAGPITIRRHQLELLPGFGKKHMQDIIKERQKKAFESFEDLNKRVKFLPDPFKAIVKRIQLELEEPGLNHYLFARPPAKERQFFRK